MPRRRIAALTAAAALVVSGLFASGAGASYHQNLIREVHETGADGDYVVLQAYAAGENLFGGVRQVVTYDGGGGPHKSVVIPSVPNGANQATVLVGDAGVPGADATAADFNVVNTGGAVCFPEGNTILGPPTGIDCVAYGTPPMLPAVPPASPYGPLLSLGGPNFDGKSLVRSITRGCATALDAADDTNDSAADFTVSTTTNPRNNAAPITETACPDPKAAKKCKKKTKKKAKKGDASAAKKKKKGCKKKKRRKKKK